MFIRKTALCLTLGLAMSGGVLAEDNATLSQAPTVEPEEQGGLIAVPVGTLDEPVVIFNDTKDDGMISEEDRIIQTAFPTDVAGVERQSGIAESLNDFTGHPDLQDLKQDEVLALDNLAEGDSKGLLKLKKVSK